MRTTMGVVVLVGLMVTACTKNTSSIEAAATSTIKINDPVAAYAMGTWDCTNGTSGSSDFGPMTVVVKLGEFVLDADALDNPPVKKYGGLSSGIPDDNETTSTTGSPEPAEVIGHWQVTGTWNLEGTTVHLDAKWNATKTSPKWSGEKTGAFTMALSGVTLEAKDLPMTEYTANGKSSLSTGRKVSIKRNGDKIDVDGHACSRRSS